MSVVRTWAVALVGLEGTPVEVEADLSKQTPEFRIIGLGDRALGEAVQRVTNACANSGLELSRRRLTVNLSPASLPKHGSGFDLAIAVAAIAEECRLDQRSLSTTVHLGELGLDGRLRPVAGILPGAVAAARAGFSRIVVPRAAAAEAGLVPGIDVVGAATLAEVARLHGAEVEVPACEPVTYPTPASPDAEPPDLVDVVGQGDAVAALVAAAAGGHHLLLSGPPGAGKTMLAHRLPGILPPLDERAALAAACVRSLSGTPVTALSRVPPIEAPHHSASMAALVGGGSRILRPGAIARASEGVLFLDEAGEFPASVLDSLRQPLERGWIDIHRAGVSARFPARFQLVLATNPCPCGNYGVRGATCECPPMAIRRYLGRLSGPLRDRIDIELQVRPVSRAGGHDPAGRMSSAAARAQVQTARARAEQRLRGTPWRRNAEVSGAWLRDGPHAPPAAVRRPLDAALERGALTLRGYDRVMRVAWTLADLASHDRVEADDIGRALFLKRGIGA